MGGVKRTEMDVETALHWAFRDELSKRQTSAAEGIWDRLAEDGRRGGVSPGSGTAQRYHQFGLPDPDAERLEKAVAALEDLVIDWLQSFDAIAGDLSGLISVNDIAKRNQAARQPTVGWGAAGDKALTAWWGPKGARPLRDRPRDVLMVGSLRTSALVIMHAIKAMRPDWRAEPPSPSPVPALKGPNAMVVGECRGRNLYTVGSYCPLQWDPSPLSIVSSRAEYVAWHHGLTALAETARLEKFVLLPPKAPQMPWLCDDEDQPCVLPVLPTPSNGVDRWGSLPLTPDRGRKLAPMRIVKAGAARNVGA